MISLAKAAKTSIRRIVRRDKPKKTVAESSNGDAPKVFSPFKRSPAKASNTNARNVVPDASTVAIPVTSTTPAAPPRSPRKAVRTAVNKIKQHVSDTLDRLVASLRGAQNQLTDSVAISVKLQQQAEEVREFVEAAEAAATQAREKAMTAAAAVGMLEHIEKQLEEKVKQLQQPLAGSSEFEEIERNLKLQHEAVMQQKLAVKQWYSNAAEAQAVHERATDMVGTAHGEFEAAQRDLAAAAAALYEAQRAALAARQMIMQAVCRAHLDDLREESGTSLEEEQLVLVERASDVVVVGHVSLAEKLRMEQGEIWQELPAELADVYGHTAVSAQRADYEQAKAAAVEATEKREMIAKLAEEIAALVDSSAAPVYILTSRALQRQMDEENLHREEAENKVKYLLTRLNWVRLAAIRGAADDQPWTAGTAMPVVEVDGDPTVVAAIEQLNIAKADLLAIERKLDRLKSIARLQSVYVDITGKPVAAGESVTVAATELMKQAVLAEIRAYRSAKYIQQSVQEACEAVQLGMRRASGQKETPERSLSRIGLEPKRLQYFMQYYLENLPKRLTTRPRETTPAPLRNQRSLPPNGTVVPPPSFLADPTPITITISAAPTAVEKPAEKKPDADIARVRAALQGFLDRGELATTSSSRPSPSFDFPSFERPGRLGASRELHPLAGTKLEVTASQSLQEALQKDGDLLDNVRSRIALIQLLERADSKVVRELVNSQLAADTAAAATAPPTPAVKAVAPVAVKVQEPVLPAGPTEKDVERVRHYYALQYMLERASATPSTTSPTPAPASSSSLTAAPVASFALSSFSDDDSSSSGSPRSSLDLTLPLPPAVDTTPIPTSTVSATTATPVMEAISFDASPAVSETEAPSSVPEIESSSSVSEIKPSVSVSEVQAPEEVFVQEPAVVAEVPAPAEMASALAHAMVEEQVVSRAPAVVKTGPTKVKRSVVITLRQRQYTLPQIDLTPPTWGEISKMMQEKGELTGSLLALSIASWGGLVATHMDNAAGVSAVYLAAGVAAISAVNRQTAALAAASKVETLSVETVSEREAAPVASAADEAVPATALPAAPSPVKVAPVMSAAAQEEDASVYATPVSTLSAAVSLEAVSPQAAESYSESVASEPAKEDVKDAKPSLWKRAKAWFTRVNNRRPELIASVLAITLGSIGCFSATVVQ